MGTETLGLIVATEKEKEDRKRMRERKKKKTKETVSDRHGKERRDHFIEK